MVWFILCLSSTAHGQSIRWTSFEHLEDSLETERRPLLVFIHTDWCTYCKMQENVIFKDSALTDRLNKNYYSLRLNAESKADIAFIGRKYRFKASRGYHELAEFIGTQGGQLIFPITVLISKRLQIRACGQGFQAADALISLLQIAEADE